MVGWKASSISCDVWHFLQPLTGEELAHRIGQVLNRTPLHIAPDQADKLIETVGWCTGGGKTILNSRLAEV